MDVNMMLFLASVGACKSFADKLISTMTASEKFNVLEYKQQQQEQNDTNVAKVPQRILQIRISDLF